MQPPLLHGCAGDDAVIIDGMAVASEALSIPHILRRDYQGAATRAAQEAHRGYGRIKHRQSRLSSMLWRAGTSGAAARVAASLAEDKKSWNVPIPWFESGQHQVSIYMDGAQVISSEMLQLSSFIPWARKQPCVVNYPCHFHRVLAAARAPPPGVSLSSTGSLMDGV